jgi:hypothetical protein
MWVLAMLAHKGAGCAWLRSRRVKNAGLFTLANSSTIKDRKAFCGFDRLWRIEQKTAQE